MREILGKTLSVLMAALMIIAFMPLLGAGTGTAYGADTYTPTVIPWEHASDYIENLPATNFEVTDNSSEVIKINGVSYRGRVYKITAPADGMIDLDVEYVSGTKDVSYCSSSKSDFSDVNSDTTGDYYNDRYACSNGDVKYVAIYSKAETYSSTVSIKAYLMPKTTGDINFGTWYSFSYLSGEQQYKMGFTATDTGCVSVNSLVGSDEAADHLQLLDENGNVISGKYKAIDEDNCATVFGVVKGTKYTLVYIPSTSNVNRIIRVEATSEALSTAKGTSRSHAQTLKKYNIFRTYAQAGTMTSHWYKFKVGKSRTISLYKYATFTGTLHFQLYNSKGKKLTMSCKKLSTDYYTVSSCKYTKKLSKGTYYLKAYTTTPKATGMYTIQYR